MEYMNIVKNFEGCTKEWIKLYTSTNDKSDVPSSSEENVKIEESEEGIDVYKDAKESVVNVDINSSTKIIRKSSTRETMESFTSACSKLQVDDKDLDYSNCKTYEEIELVRNQIITMMHLKYIQFDRYIRCPTHYHRAKIIVKDGKDDKIKWN